MVSLPRSVRLAASASVWLAGDGTVVDVVDGVRGDDEPHAVEGLPSGRDVALSEALHELRSAGARAAAVALPRPGDPQGLGGPRALTEAAVDAGEAVLAVGARVALVPRVTAFGPPGDQGHFVTWRWHVADPVPPGPGLAEAERALSVALLQAGSILADLDIASWRPEVAQLLEDVRAGRESAPLPHAYPAPAQALAARAARLWAVTDFALGDDGGATSASASAARRQALHPLERAARHALAAACNSLSG
jgi:hypothetical protein